MKNKTIILLNSLYTHLEIKESYAPYGWCIQFKNRYYFNEKNFFQGLDDTASGCYQHQILDTIQCHSSVQ